MNILSLALQFIFIAEYHIVFYWWQKYCQNSYCPHTATTTLLSMHFGRGALIF